MKKFMKKKMTVFQITPLNTDVTDLKKFETYAARAAKAGATHIIVTEVEKSRWIWERDLSDPYPNWGMLNSALFKIIVPKELKSYLPQDYADRNFALIKKRCAILKKYGLKAAAYFAEPFYLPEEVYRDHPDWRGPRCDHPRRATNYYYSPCMDNPEVLAMYRGAMKRLCEAAEIDYVYLHTNDCGAGICHSTGLYDGPNGPESCKNIPLAQRILGYFRVFRQGAADAGRDIFIETNSNIGFKADESVMDAVWPLLDDGMAVNFKNNKGLPLSSLVEVNHEFTYSPVRCIPSYFEYLRQLQAAFESESTILKVYTYDDDLDGFFTLYEMFCEHPTRSFADRAALLKKFAAKVAGARNAGALVDAWQAIDTSLKHFLDTCIEGFSWTSVNQRLINRPFVLFPEELDEDEKSYWRPYLFQAVDEKQANDLLNNQNTSFIRGYYAVFLASKCLQKMRTQVETARKLYLKVAETAENADLFRLAADRLSLLNCFAKNYLHAMKFQDIVDSTDYSEEPEISPQWPLDADPRLLEYERLTRAEIDNTYEIIRLIEGREREMLLLAPTAALEDIFWLSPEITGQLRVKANTMLNHQLDGKRLYRTNNK